MAGHVAKRGSRKKPAYVIKYYSSLEYFVTAYIKESTGGTDSLRTFLLKHVLYCTTVKIQLDVNNYNSSYFRVYLLLLNNLNKPDYTLGSPRHPRNDDLSK